MARKRTPFHFSMGGVEIRIEDTEARPGLMDSVLALVDRVAGRHAPVGLPESPLLTPPTESAAAPLGKSAITPARLTARELEVARLIVDGLTTPQIAERLSLEQTTIKKHRSHIRKAVGTSERTGLAAKRGEWDNVG